jgi:aerobic C4-dicarboxylate transport protein
VVVAKWTGDLDQVRLARELDNASGIESEEPEAELDESEAHMPVTAGR